MAEVAMDLGQWLSAFKALHERARRGSLEGVDERDYKAGREELARALVAAQRLTLQPGQSPRHALRVARALQVDLESPVRKERLTTFDLSLGGFSALLARAPMPDEALTATLRLPGMEPMVAPVTVAGLKAQPGNVRVSFAFGKLEGAVAERLELAIFDAVLGQLGQ
jgi:PilZ domain-containing protein